MLMRRPCQCGGTEAKIVTKGGQDVVYCAECGKWAGYNAPKTETGRCERTIETGHKINPSMRAKILLRANGHCELCGASPTPEHPLHVAHLLSVKDGMLSQLTEQELNSPENLAAMCDACNLGLGDETVPLRLAVAIVFTRTKNRVNGDNRESLY